MSESDEDLEGSIQAAQYLHDFGILAECHTGMSVANGCYTVHVQRPQ